MGEDDVTEMVNVAVIEGLVKGQPLMRESEDGSVRISFDVKGDAGEVPVTWFGSKAKVPSVKPGDRVTVRGSIRRYFYRSGGGAVASRTDVVASSIVFGAGKRRRAAIARWSNELKKRVEERPAA